MSGSVFRRVPVSVPPSFQLLKVFLTLRQGVLALFLLWSPAGLAATSWMPWQVAATPTLSLATLDGDTVGLDDLRGRLVVVHFFATWCEPCRPELLALERMAARFAGEPVAILAVDSGEPEARIRRFFSDTPVSFPILLDGDRAALKRWQVKTFPTSFIVAGDRAPLLIAQGVVDWDSDAVADRIAGLIDATETSSRKSLTNIEQTDGNEGEIR